MQFNVQHEKTRLTGDQTGLSVLCSCVLRRTIITGNKPNLTKIEWKVLYIHATATQLSSVYWRRRFVDYSLRHRSNRRTALFSYVFLDRSSRSLGMHRRRALTKPRGSQAMGASRRNKHVCRGAPPCERRSAQQRKTVEEAAAVTRLFSFFFTCIYFCRGPERSVISLERADTKRAPQGNMTERKNGR